MRFKLEQHKEGSIRYKKRFAFWPRRIGNTRIWLECYYEQQAWVHGFYEFFIWSSYKYSWKFREYILADDIRVSPLRKALE